MKRAILFLLILFISPLINFAQEEYYSDPVKIPILLSGSFAELRNNHFHSGIDIKTQGITGIPVYSSAEGNISRIVVSPSGFGRAIYIDHTNGTTSVYGHLSRFRDDIQRYIKKIQYKRRSFQLDIHISKNTFPVSRDDLIGYSGNTGSSGGPHLHFEIRDAGTREPMNPLNSNITVNDNIPPKIYSLMITPLERDSHVEFGSSKKIYPVFFKEGCYRTEKTSIPVFGKIGFAIHVNDYFDGSNNKCGVYSMKLKIDGETYYSYSMDRFSFNETRYINSHIDYEEYITGKKRFIKTWIDPGNKLSIYKDLHKNGKCNISDDDIHDVRIEVCDINGNNSILNFSVESIPGYVDNIEEGFDKIFRYNKFNSFWREGIMIEMPENSLYNDLKFNYNKLPALENCFSPLHVIHNKTVPLHKSARLSVMAQDIDKKITGKALLVEIDTLTGDFKAVTSYYKNGWVTGNIRSFGNYAVAVDTLPPEITPLSIKNKSELTEYSRLRFRISDELSGIKSITGMMDGKWVLFEYDAKSKLITHYFDKERFEMDRLHKLILSVSDQKGNKNTYEASFRR